MWLNFVPSETKHFSLPLRCKENYVSCLKSLSNWKFLGFPSSTAHHSPSFPHADQKSRIDNRCWYWFHKFNKKRCAPSFYSPLRSKRGEIKVRQFSCENFTHVTVSSGVVNVDTNGIIKILLIRIYDAVFEVCLNFRVKSAVDCDWIRWKRRWW